MPIREIIFTGFYESGLSPIGRALYESGLFIGDRLKSGDLFHPHPQYEDLTVSELHEEILKSNRCTGRYDGSFPLKISPEHRREMARLIRERNRRFSSWGFGDSRAALFLPEWFSLMESPGAIILYRHYREAVSRLLHRAAGELLLDGLESGSAAYWEDPDLPYRMWLAWYRPLVALIHRDPQRCLCLPGDVLREGYDIASLFGGDSGLSAPVIIEERRNPSEDSEALITAPEPGAALRRELDELWHQLQSLSPVPGEEPPEEMERRQIAGEDSFEQVSTLIRQADLNASETAEKRFVTLLGQWKREKSDPLPSLSGTISQARAEGTLERLISRLRSVLRSAPEDPSLLRSLEALLAAAGEVREAETLLDHMKQLRIRGAAYVYFRRAKLSLDSLRIDEAAQHLEQAMRHHPDHPKFHLLLGMLEKIRGRYTAALRAYARAAALFPPQSNEMFRTKIEQLSLCERLGKTRCRTQLERKIRRLAGRGDHPVSRVFWQLGMMEWVRTPRPALEGWIERFYISRRGFDRSRMLASLLARIDEASPRRDLLARIARRVETLLEKRAEDFRIDFLVVGVQKAGTTTLDAYLRTHPRIRMPRRKELRFFNDERYFEEQRIPYELYHEHFDRSVEGEERPLYGEVSPLYAYWPSAIRRIWEYHPDIKIILLLRNPIERAYSQWNMEYGNGRESLPFSEAIRREPERAKSALPFRHRIYSYIDRGFYSEQLREIYRFFPKEQVLVLRHETLKENPAELLKQVSDFLGIEAFSCDTSLHEHHSVYPEPLSPDLYNRLASLYAAEISQLEKMLGWSCETWSTPRS